MQRSRSGTLHLAGTQTSGASVNMCRSTVNDSLYTSYIGLPGSVRSSVRVRNLDTEGYTLSADLTFCHAVAPPFPYVDRTLSAIPEYYNTSDAKMQVFLQNFHNFIFFRSTKHTAALSWCGPADRTLSAFPAPHQCCRSRPQAC